MILENLKYFYDGLSLQRFINRKINKNLVILKLRLHDSNLKNVQQILC